MHLNLQVGIKEMTRTKSPAQAIYLRSPEPQRSTMLVMRERILKIIPDATEVVSYGMPAFKQNGIIVYYAAFTNHMSLFVMPAVLNEVRALIPGRSTTKSAIHFTENDPIPAAVVAQCILLRVREIEQKMAAKKVKKTAIASNTKPSSNNQK